MWGAVALLSGLGSSADVQDPARQYNGYYSPGIGRIPGIASGDSDRIEGARKVASVSIEPNYGTFSGVPLGAVAMPSGKTLAFVALGVAGFMWWRKRR